MAMTPLILLPSDNRTTDNYLWHGAVDTYVRAVAHVGAVPLILPNLAAIDLDAALERVDGLMLTGARSNERALRALRPRP